MENIGRYFTKAIYAYYSVMTKWAAIEKYSDLWDLYNFSLKKLRKTETKLPGTESRLQ